MAVTDFDAEIKQLRATMKTIGQVLDLDGMRAEIADLGVRVAAPDLWDDQENATRVTGRLSGIQGQLDRFTIVTERSRRQHAQPFEKIQSEIAGQWRA